MTERAGLLLEPDTRNCWTLAQALGHRGPHRLQHLLSRARFDHGLAQREIAGLVAGELAGQDVVLVVDETGDAKSSTDCVGAGRQYSGALGGVGLCQLAVHLAAVTATTKVIIDRVLYLPADWAGDEERREMAGVPEEVGFATKPQQALAMVADALATGIAARWFAGDEVYCGRELRRGIRSLHLARPDPPGAARTAGRGRPAAPSPPARAAGPRREGRAGTGRSRSSRAGRSAARAWAGRPRWPSRPRRTARSPLPSRSACPPPSGSRAGWRSARCRASARVRPAAAVRRSGRAAARRAAGPRRAAGGPSMPPGSGRRPGRSR
ncbi:IS701 family transposase [Streptomyces sp. NPDC001193]